MTISKKVVAVSKEAFLPIEHHMRALGCERVILGCTELSLLKKEMHLGNYFIDSMEVLAQSIILAFGKRRNWISVIIFTRNLLLQLVHFRICKFCTDTKNVKINSQIL